MKSFFHEHVDHSREYLVPAFYLFFFGKGIPLGMNQLLKANMSRFQCSDRRSLLHPSSDVFFEYSFVGMSTQKVEMVLKNLGWKPA
jgi:hypothetical protein